MEQLYKCEAWEICRYKCAHKIPHKLRSIRVATFGINKFRSDCDTNPCSHVDGAKCIPVKEETMDEVVTIKKADLIKAAEKAGSHRDVIEALCPEAFGKKFEAKIGDVYKLCTHIYMLNSDGEGGYNFNGIHSGIMLGNMGNKKSLTEVSEFLNNERDILNITYLGHAKDILEIKEEM